MDKAEKRIEFLKKLKEVNSLINWCKIKVNPNEKEEIQSGEIKKTMYIGKKMMTMIFVMRYVKMKNLSNYLQ